MGPLHIPAPLEELFHGVVSCKLDKLSFCEQRCIRELIISARLKSDASQTGVEL